MEKPESIKEQVRKHYALKARRVRQGADRAACCGSGESISCGDPITSNLYRDDVKGSPSSRPQRRARDFASSTGS